MEAPRTTEVYPAAAGHAPSCRIATDPGGGDEQKRLYGLLRETTRLIEHSDLVRVSEKLREAGELVAGKADHGY